MNLHLLKIYTVAVRECSFTTAAELLGISQPAVSQAVRELESQLDTLLLDRRGRFFTTNPAGQMLYEYGRSIYALEEEASETLRAFRDLERGELIIGASTTLANYWLPSLVQEFSSRYPHIRIKVLGANTSAIANLLLDCKVDLALVEGAVEDPRIESRVWRSEEMIAIIAPSGHGARGKKPGVWVVREEGSGSREFTLEWLKQAGQELHLLEVSSNEAIIQTVAAGLGAGIVPKITVRDQLALGRVKSFKLDGQKHHRPLYRLRLPRRPISNAALAFEALLGMSAKAIG